MSADVRHPALKMPPTTYGLGRGGIAGVIRIQPRDEVSPMSIDADTILSVTQNSCGPPQQDRRGYHLALGSRHLTADDPDALVERHAIHSDAMSVARSGHPDAPVTRTRAIHTGTRGS